MERTDAAGCQGQEEDEPRGRGLSRDEALAGHGEAEAAEAAGAGEVRGACAARGRVSRAAPHGMGGGLISSAGLYLPATQRVTSKVDTTPRSARLVSTTRR